MIHIAVDAGAFGPGNGIGRYLDEVLRRMIADRSVARRWSLYGRDAAMLSSAFAAAGPVTARGDALPVHAGRVGSLFTSQPWWLARDRPDLFWGPAHRLPLFIPAGTARVVTVHDLCWLHVPATMRPSTRRLDRALMPRALQAADRIVAVSQSTKKALAQAFPAVAGRIVVVAEAASAMPPPDDVGALAPLGVRTPYVLCAGTIEPRKNLQRLFEAFARVETPARLVLAGAPGWSTGAPGEMAERAGIAERVTCLGAVDDRTLATLYAYAAFLAMPSLYEGFGLPILEAMAHGTPVLFGDNSSMPEVAGDAGLAVDAGSVDSIAQGMSMLLGDDALRASLAARARAQAAKFSWDRAARETLAVFDEAIAARRAR